MLYEVITLSFIFNCIFDCFNVFIGGIMNLLTLWNLEREEVLKIIEDAEYFKKNRYGHDILKNKSIALIFESPSTRTRMSFDLAVHELGGHSLMMNEGEIHLGKKESIADTARVMSRFVDARITSYNVCYTKLLRHSIINQTIV